MGHTTFSIRMDEDVKKQFDAFCASVGMNASTAFNLFARTVIRERRIPFEITDENPFYSKENWQHLVAAAKRMEKTGGTIHDLIEVESEDND